MGVPLRHHFVVCVPRAPLPDPRELAGQLSDLGQRMNSALGGVVAMLAQPLCAVLPGFSLRGCCLCLRLLFAFGLLSLSSTREFPVYSGCWPT